MAHGGTAGAIAESFVVVGVTSLFVAVWIRERRARKEQAHEGPARLKDPDAE